MGEHSLVIVRASVMLYDEMSKKWIPGGGCQGVSKVHIYQNPSTNTFRVVGHRIQDHESSINCHIVKGLKYNQATPTFHQWRDNKQVYGLNFSSEEEATNFAAIMMMVVNQISMSSNFQRQMSTPASSYHENTFEQQKMMLHHHASLGYNNQPAMCQMIPQPLSNMMHNINASTEDLLELRGSQTRKQEAFHKGHKRTSSQGCVLSAGCNNKQTPSNNWYESIAPVSQPEVQAVPPPPPLNQSIPPSPLDVTAPPPPPPPPPPPLAAPQLPLSGTQNGSLANAIKNAKLKKVKPSELKPHEIENSGNSVSSISSSSSASSNYSGGRTVQENMLSEMQKKLKERRAKVEQAEGENKNTNSKPNDPLLSPKQQSRAKRFQSLTATDVYYTSTIIGTTNSNKFDAFKAEVLMEVRKEINLAKDEIIEAIKLQMIRN